MATATMRRTRLIRNERGGRFRLLIGLHFGNGPEGCECEACMTSNGTNHNYVAGDVIASPKRDLERIHNQGPHSRKFDRVSDDTPLTPPFKIADDDAEAAEEALVQTVTEDELKAMSLAKLKAFAKDNEIDLHDKVLKEDILNLVLTALTD